MTRVDTFDRDISPVRCISESTDDKSFPDRYKYRALTLNTSLRRLKIFSYSTIARFKKTFQNGERLTTTSLLR